MERFISRTRCEVCGSDAYTVLISREFSHPSIASFLDVYYNHRIPPYALDGVRYELARCARCGFIWQRYVLDDAGLRRLYSEWISGDQSVDTKHASLTSVNGRIRELQAIRYLTGASTGAVLDYGMGWGYWCMVAQQFGYEAYGIEYAPDRIRHARAQGITVMDLNVLPENFFLFINAEQVFEHLVAPRAVLNKLVWALRPGGILRIAVPDVGLITPDIFNKGWRAKKGPLQPLEHINCFTRSSLLRFGREAGLISMSIGTLAQKLFRMPRLLLRIFVKSRTIVYFIKP